MKYVFVIVLITIIGCKEKTTRLKFGGKEYNIDNRAIELNNKATSIFIANADSVDYAIKMLSESIQIDSNYFLAYQNKINFEKNLKKFDFGIGTIRAFINRFPDNPSAYLALGLLQEKKGDSLAARLNYRMALDLPTKSYKLKNERMDSVKDMVFVLTYLNGDTLLASRQFEKFKAIYDTSGYYQGIALWEYVNTMR